jgi:hypothetical protein
MDFAQGVEHPATGGNRLPADTVSGNRRNFIYFHRVTSLIDNLTDATFVPKLKV